MNIAIHFIFGVKLKKPWEKIHKIPGNYQRIRNATDLLFVNRAINFTGAVIRAFFIGSHSSPGARTEDLV
jgi:hypothetical protein